MLGATRVRKLILLSICVHLFGCSDEEAGEGGFECAGDFEVASEGDLAALIPCTRIDGGLWFTHQTWLESIELPYLERVDGPLLVGWNENLQQVHLPVLERVEGSMSLGDNPELDDFLAPKLEAVGDSTTDDWYSFEGTHVLSIEGNTALPNLEGFAGLESVRGALLIQDNPSLIDLDGLSELRYVALDMEVESNTHLTTLAGLSNLTDVHGHFFIYGNPELTDIDGLSGLTLVGNISIRENDALTSVALPGLTTVDGIAIQGNDSLPSLQGLSGLPSELTGLYIIQNDALLDLDDLSSITSVGWLTVEDNDALTSFVGLEGLTSVTTDLEIIGNDLLPHLDALSSLSAVGNDLIVQENSCLSQTEAEAFAASIEVGGTNTVESNGAHHPCD